MKKFDHVTLLSRYPGNIKPSSSPVSSFHPGTAGASKLYDKPGDLFVSPLSTSSYGLIVSTYEKTIGLSSFKLKFYNEKNIACNLDIAVDPLSHCGPRLIN